MLVHKTICFMVHIRQVCVLSYSDHKNYIARVIHELDVNFATLPPMLHRVLCPENVPGMKVSCLGREAFTEKLIETGVPRVRISNFER
jgi:hypothetical protein